MEVRRAAWAGWLSIGALVCACRSGERRDPAPPAPAAPVAAAPVPVDVARTHMPQRAVGRMAAVATAHALSTQAAQHALLRGGSAVDALVAASMMLSVVQPQSTGIGGGGFAIVLAADGSASALDFRETAPAAMRLGDYLDATGNAVADRSRRGGLSVAVPGYVAGLGVLHARYGKRPWSEDVAEAVDVAQRGFPIGAELAQAIGVVQGSLSPAGRAGFLPRGVVPKVGDVLAFPHLAATLRAIAAEGPDAFYRGAIAGDLARTAQQAGGRMTEADLAAYRPRWVEPLRGRAFDSDILTMPQPSAGGAQLLAMADLVAGWQAERDLACTTLVRPKGKPQAAPVRFFPGPCPLPLDEVPHLWAEAMRRSFVLRLRLSGDGGTTARALADVYPPAAMQDVAADYAPHRAALSSRWLAPTAPKEAAPNTSHVSIIDADGMAVSSTHTVNLLLGSGVVGKESGVLLNDEMDDFTFAVGAPNAFGLVGSAANLARPGARPVSSMTPVIMTRHGQIALVVGTPGGTRIPTVVMQVMARVAAQGLAAAVAAPRIHHQALPDQVDVETGQPGADLLAEQLSLRGHMVHRRGPWCNVQAIALLRSATGTQWEAVSDPRGEGGAAAW